MICVVCVLEVTLTSGSVSEQTW